ncbi:MAG: hypothetical protein OXG04_23855, partial [Acidobacteria bacterium]|nr:hypothetical protein [Acidobacteriota bacterium]
MTAIHPAIAYEPGVVPEPLAEPVGLIQFLRWVWLFFVDGPGGFCKRHGKSYLTRRRRGGEGGGGGSLTGGAVRAAY